MKTFFSSDEWAAATLTSSEHWLPLIALYSGMRLDEIASLRTAEDIKCESGVWFFHVQEQLFDWDEAGSVAWNAKTLAGHRKVPIHRWLIEYGLLQLVEMRRATKSLRLFPDLKPSGPDNKRSAEYSREFSRIKNKIGIPNRVVFHSFRHTFRTRLTQLVLGSIIDALMGHDDSESINKSARDYNHPSEYDIEILQHSVNKFVSPFNLDHLIKNRGNLEL